MSNRFLDAIVTRAEAEATKTFAVLHRDGDWTSYTVADLVERAKQFAALFAENGLAPGQVIFIILKFGFDCYASFLGAMLAGGVPSFLPYPNAKHDHKLYWEQHHALFMRVRPRLILTFDELRDEIEICARGSGAIALGLSRAEQTRPAFQAVASREADVALLQHSSGTTGLKKGVALSYEAIIKQLDAYAPTIGMEQDGGSVIGSWLPLYHDMGLISSFLLPLYLGAPIIGMDPFAWSSDPKLLLQAIEAHRVTHVWLPNFAFMHLVRAVPRKFAFDLASVQAWISCSEPCKPAAFDAFLTRWGACGVDASRLQTCYAMAETVFAVSQSQIGRPVRRLSVSRTATERAGRIVETDGGDDGASVTLLSNGRVVDGCDVAILSGGAFVGENEMGELCLRADFMFSGYFKNDEATKAAFVDGWYRTGDMGFLRDGEIFISGRIKDVIIVNGKNVFAHDVEGCLAEVAGLKPGRAVAIGVYDERAGSEQLVVVAERTGPQSDEGQIMGGVNAAVLEAIGIACSDVKVVDVGWLIKTTSGKISRSENLKKYLEEKFSESNDVLRN